MYVYGIKRKSSFENQIDVNLIFVRMNVCIYVCMYMHMHEKCEKNKSDKGNEFDMFIIYIIVCMYVCMYVYLCMCVRVCCKEKSNMKN